MGKKSLHLFATVNALQTGILMCLTPLFPLLRPLLFDINTRHEWETYIGYINAVWRFCYTFLDSSIYIPSSLWALSYVVMGSNF